jgi:hypothetical protein
VSARIRPDRLPAPDNRLIHTAIAHAHR